MRDIDRDRFMSPEDAIAYGLIDQILPARDAAAARAAAR
jgi:ATP-dependent protease ClpP protease subunit